VKWKTICSPVAVDGLGIKDIGSFNDALIAKWRWRYGVSEDSLWRDILQERYRPWRNMDVTPGHRNHSLWWKVWCHICGKGTQGNWFDSRFQWTLGDR